MKVSDCAFTNNSTTNGAGGGAAVANLEGILTVSFSRIVSNTAASGSGGGIYQSAGASKAGSSITAIDN
jgi:hypothetical protein